jgi:Tfp pilus assembly protein PilV
MKTKKGATLVGSLVAVTILATTLVSVLNLQVSIIRAKFFLQYDNTANLLVAEGLEIVRAIYANGGNIPTGNNKYKVDYNTTSLTEISSCLAAAGVGLNPSCHLDEPSGGEGYKISNTRSNKIFHRFVEIDNPDPTTIPPKITSNVIVCNFRIGRCRDYKATIELYKIN